MRRLASLPLLCLAAVACDAPSGTAPAETLAAPELPKATCAHADASLLNARDQLMLEFGAPGEATIPKANWQRLEASGREAVYNALAVKAACAAPRTPAEQHVVIKDESGQAQSERTVAIYQIPRIDEGER